jgi:hypothetical protein
MKARPIMTAQALARMLSEYEKKFGKPVMDWTAEETIQFFDAKKQRLSIAHRYCPNTPERRDQLCTCTGKEFIWHEFHAAECPYRIQMRNEWYCIDHMQQRQYVHEGMEMTDKQAVHIKISWRKIRASLRRKDK